MTIHYKSPAEIEWMYEAGQTLKQILDIIVGVATSGVSTWEIDKLAHGEMQKRGVKSAFLGYYDYPAVTCISVNDVVVHGIPSKKIILQDGDIVSIDCGIFKKGFCADAARTKCIGDVTESNAVLVETTKLSLDNGISYATPGARLGDIGSAIQTVCESKGYGVVRDFTGHGIGRAMHEDPAVHNVGKPGRGRRLKQGLVIAIEPMVCLGEPDTEVLEDGWTAVTVDGRRAAHFEDTIAITADGPRVLTR